GQLMLALYRSGRQAEALRAYQDMRARLGGEMGLEPSPALRQLEQDILLQRPAADWRPSTILALALAGTEAGGAPPPLPPSLGRARRFPFVGRQRELALLHDRWNAVAEDGQLRAVILSGEPGAGKTRLAAEFATEVHGAGAHVLFGAADEGPLMPYQPLAEAIGRYLDQLPPPDVESIRATHGGALTRIVPEFAVGACLPPPGDEDETERYRLFSAAGSFLARQSAVAPLLLVVDDLQWADEASLSLLRHVLRRGEVRAMIVATYRDTDIRADHPLHAWLADVQRNESVVLVRLGGLDAHEIGLLISTVSESLGDGSGREAAEVLERRTKGNAFFVCELLADGYRPDGGVPQTVRAAVVQRLAHLSDDVSRSLTVAAVLGREFDVRVVEQVAGMAAEPILLATEEAARAGIIDEQAGSEGTYQFAHGLFREVLYDALSGWRRRRLHAEVARCLEAMPAPQPTTRRRVAELAYHFVEAGEAGDLAKAVGYAATAAEDALASLAYEEAARYYRMALSTGRADSRDGDLLLGLAQAESGRGDVDAALAGVVAAADLARRSVAVEPLAEAALTLAQIRRSVKGDAVRDALLREAFAVLPESDSGLRVRLLVARQHTKEGGDWSLQAVAMARRLGDPRVLAVALEGRLAALDRQEDGPERLRLSAELTQISDQIGDREKAFVAQLHRYWTQFEAAGWPRPAR
ncbi:MAG: ATP-binding protein, partial [Acidimicrobiales bacterium]